MLKLSNNGVTKLVASLSTTATEFAVTPGSGSLFPTLSAGDWFPLTVIRPNGALEIMYVTARSGDVFTVQRAREGTAALAFAADDRAESRATAGIFAEFFQKSGGVVTGDVEADGDLHAKNGTLYLNGTRNRFLQHDGTDYLMPGSDLKVNGSKVWTAASFNPANYLPLAGGTMTGTPVISNATPTITFTDTGWGDRSIQADAGNIGFRNSSGTLVAYSQNDGTWLATGNIGAYSDRKHKRDITQIDGGLGLVERLRGVRYTRRRDGAACMGVIAQEVAEVLPEVVGETKDGLYVDYGNMVAPLIEAVKELSGRVRKLEDA